MQHTDSHGKDHLYREPGYLSVREPSVHAERLKPHRSPGCFENAHSEECSEEQSHEESHSAEETDKPVHLAQTRALHLQLHEQCNEHEHDTVSGITHTHGKEQHEERTEHRRRVKFIINRHAVHSGQHLEILGEPVVVQLDRRIVLLGSRLVDVIYSESVERITQPLVILSRSESGNYGKMTVRRHFSSRLSQIQVKRSKFLIVTLSEFSDAAFQIAEQLFPLREFRLQILDGEFHFIDRTLRGRHRLDREAVLFRNRSHSHEEHGRIRLTDHLQRLDFSPCGVELLLLAAVEAYFQSLSLQSSDGLSAELPPRLAGRKFLFCGRQLILEFLHIRLSLQRSLDRVDVEPEALFRFSVTAVQNSQSLLHGICLTQKRL